MKETKFYLCGLCGNLVGLIVNGGGPLSCCGQAMGELVPNTAEASQEKHLPEVNVSGCAVNVKVGSAAHPMTDEHNIPFVYLQTEGGGQRVCLKPGDNPEACFSLCCDDPKCDCDKPVAVYAYCNLHGLWKTEVK